ncbi:MAG: hypothetical protein E6929_11730 [Clostridium sp.]|nr:hypothetical protein [Clostridium sp.]
MNNFYENIYELESFYRNELLKIEKHRTKYNIGEEQFVKQRLLESNLEMIFYKEKACAKDDGIDFVFKYNNEIYICQLKYWKKSLGLKQIKVIYGDMFFSELAIKYRNNNMNTKYILICPFLNAKCNKFLKEYSKYNYYLIANEKFIQLILNPTYFFEKKIYERDDLKCLKKE